MNEKVIDPFIVRQTSKTVKKLEEELAELQKLKEKKDIIMQKAASEVVSCVEACIDKKHQLDALKQAIAFYTRAFD